MRAGGKIVLAVGLASCYLIGEQCLHEPDLLDRQYHFNEFESLTWARIRGTVLAECSPPSTFHDKHFSDR